MQIPSFLQSSVDPQKLSLTIKAAIVGIIPFLAIIKAVSGLDIAPSLVEEIAEQVGTLITVLWAAGSLIGVVYGLIRKAFPPKLP